MRLLILFFALPLSAQTYTVGAPCTVPAKIPTKGYVCPTTKITILPPVPGPVGKQGAQGVPGPQGPAGTPATLPTSFTMTVSCDPAAYVQKNPTPTTITIAGAHCTVTAITVTP